MGGTAEPAGQRHPDGGRGADPHGVLRCCAGPEAANAQNAMWLRTGRVKKELPVTQTSSSRVAVSMLPETTTPWQPEGRKGVRCAASQINSARQLAVKTSGTYRQRCWGVTQTLSRSINRSAPKFRTKIRQGESNLRQRQSCSTSFRKPLLPPCHELNPWRHTRNRYGGGCGHHLANQFRRFGLHWGFCGGHEAPRAPRCRR